MATYNPFSQRLEESGLSTSTTATEQVEAQIAALQAAVAALTVEVGTKADAEVAGVYEINSDGIFFYNSDQSLNFELTVSGSLGAETVGVEQPGVP